MNTQDPTLADRRSVIRSYITAVEPHSHALTEGLWVLPPDVLSSGDRSLLFEQYKLYVEQAERLSVRRTLTSAFFLALNLLVLAGASILLVRRPDQPYLLAVPLIAVLVECLAWFWLVRSYRQLASAKYAVITHLEKQLPAAPGVAEWAAVGLGRDNARYLPMSNVEMWVPAVFAVCHVLSFALLFLPR
ncbi:MAG: hypothetical protein J2O46_05575 [Nocardioides sp.]|nr:hypothetical protein [Nocardioides sp.]